MRKGVLVFLLLLAAGLPAASREDTTDPQEVVRLAWFYKPPKNTDLTALVRNFDVFILTRADEPVRDQLKQIGVKAPFLQYLRFDAIEDPRSCNETPHRNQAAHKPGDFCRISAENPHWFMKDNRGQRISSDNYYFMNPMHPGWRNFFLERARDGQEVMGWDGVFLDNVEGSLIKRHKHRAVPAAFPVEKDYVAAIEDCLKYMYEEYFHPQGRPLWGNVISVKNPEVWFKYLKYMDGVMMESFAVDWQKGYRDPQEWQQHLAIAERVQALGKHIILVAQGGRWDLNRQKFAYASYLLVASGNASFRYTLSNQYVESWLYDNYKYRLGAPRGPRYYQAGLWRRNFTNALVSVNPRNHEAAITFR